VTWYRSLYWRIALGFIACLALLLAVQGVLFVWMMQAAGSAVPSQSPERLAQAVAVDVGQALDRDPALDVPQYLHGEYGRDTQPFFVLLADGRAVEVGARFPDILKDEARARLDQLKNVDPARLGRGAPFGRGPMFRPGERGGAGGPDGGSRFAPGPRPRFDRGADDSGRPPYRPDDSRFFGPDRGPMGSRGGPGGFRTGRPAIIVANSKLAGLVLVPPQPPFTFLLTRYGPTLLTVAAATLVMGGILAALVIFGPTRRRLRAVEDAARRLGAGDLTARAPSAGDDEVAAMASAFNAMADDLTARTEALVAVDRARRQLLADVSHELNTPVTAMRGYVETLSMPELSLDEETRARYIRIVGDETARLERTIGDLLDLARLEGGGGSLMLEQVRVEDLFARVLARHERAAAAGPVLMRAQIEPGAETIVADRTRMEQALQNLAANALRYAPAGSALELRARLLDDAVALSVADQGPGIPPQHLARVFDRFYKVDESRVAAQAGNSGSGLGLSIVKAIVERHGATIAVESRPGRTVFQVAGLRRPGGREPLPD
jgi:two-component system sensor histidine kinase BaeS